MNRMQCVVLCMGAMSLCMLNANEEAGAQKNPITGPPPLEGWKLVWNDEFDGQAIDSTKWSPCERGPSDWNNTMSKDPRCMALENGLLKLRGFENEDLKRDPSPFLTGGVQSKGKFSFTHDKIVIRARFKSATGAWPALWLLGTEGGWPHCGEIDLMEHLNHDDIVYQTIHSQWANHGDAGKTLPKGDTTKIDRDGFNTYGIERWPDKLVFSVNGQPSFTYPRVPEKGPEQWPFDRPFYIILSMQIGGDWVGKPDPKDFPADMEIDWVRVYERLPAPEPAAEPTTAVAPEANPTIAGKRVISYALAGRHGLFDDPATRDLIFPDISHVVLIGATKAAADGTVSVDEKLLGNAVAENHSKTRKISATFLGPYRDLFANSQVPIPRFSSPSARMPSERKQNPCSPWWTM